MWLKIGFLFTLLFHTVSIAQTTQKTVVAIKGDGVYTILRKNGLDPIKYYRDFIELNKENLNSNDKLYIGKKYLLPINKELIIDTKNTLIDSTSIKKIDSPSSKIKEIEYPLFGKKYSNISIENNALEGTVYYLISGHGGPDPGAIEKYNEKLIAEDEYAYDVTLRIARKLLSKGAKVYVIIQDNDDGIRDKRLLEIDYDEINYPKAKIKRSQKLRLKQRTETVNSLYLKHKGSFQRLIVTHVDSRSKGKNIDVFFYHHKNSKKGKKLAENIQSTFKKKYAKYQPNRIYSGTVGSRSNLYVIKNTLPAIVYIELGNIKNKKDQRRILDYENRDAMAKWIVEGIVSDFTSK